MSDCAGAFSEEGLLRLVPGERGKNRYAAAVTYCRAAIDAGLDRHWWLKQLGFVQILNDVDDFDAFLVEMPRTFETLAREYPGDADAHFWLGYAYQVAVPRHDEAAAEYETALRLDPDHAYASSNLAFHVAAEEAVPLLEHALLQQPGNLGDLQRLAKALTTLCRCDEARATLQAFLTAEPYVETRLGVLNSYVNGWNGIGWFQEEMRADAIEVLGDWEGFCRDVARGVHRNDLARPWEGTRRRQERLLRP